jgi:phosphate transport system substrate-binding protein
VRSSRPGSPAAVPDPAGIEEEARVSIPRTLRIAGVVVATAAVVVACSSSGSTAAPTADAGGGTAAPTADANLSGEIVIDGSSTVYPITEAVAEEFQKANAGVKVSVAFSGTGGGFKKFCAGETDANDASRPIKTKDEPDAKSEATTCKENGIEPVELQVAYDGLTVVVNPENTWATCITTDELTRIWDQGSTVSSWSDIRPDWPAEPIKLFGPGADSGTFDYFTEVINGEVDRSRSDYTQSEDDNALVQGVAGDKGALGYFGFAYFEENTDKLKALEVDSGAGCVAPTRESIASDAYTPLSRPLFVYPSKQSLARPEVAAFFRYYLDNVNTYVDEVGYVTAPADILQTSQDALAAATAQ